MPYINEEKIVKIRNALAVILRASFNRKQDDRLLIVRQVGKIDKLFPKRQERRGGRCFIH